MSGGGGSQTTTQEFKAPTWATTGNMSWQNYMNGMNSAVDWLANPQNTTYNRRNPYTSAGSWQGSEQDLTDAGRVANFNDMQNYGRQKIVDNAQNPLFGSDINGYMRGILNGNGSNWNVLQDWVNPFADAENPYATFENAAAGQQNRYGGETNPYFENMLKSQRTNAEDTYNRTTAANLDSMQAQDSAFGGSAFGEQRAANQRSLQDSLNQWEQGARNDQYGRAAGLEQQRLDQLYGATESGINRAAQGEESRLNRGLQGTENYYNRGMQDFQGMMGYEMNALGMIPQMAQTQGNLAQQIMGAGDSQRAYEQEVINAMRQAQQERMSAGLLPWDVWGNALQRASGQGGSTLTSMAQSVSPWTTAGGLGLLGAGLLTRG